MHPSFDQRKEIPAAAASILESITDAFLCLNSKWEFTFLNHHAETIFDRQRSELLGKNIWVLYPQLTGSEFETLCRKAEGEQASASATAYYPGHDRWYEVHAHPAEEGTAIYFRDATERVRNEKQLRKSERRFRLLADSIPQIVWIIDDAGHGVYFNRQWSDYTGVSLDAIAPEDITEGFVHPDDEASTMRDWRTAFTEGRAFSSEHRIRSASGEYRWFMVRATPYRDPDSAKIVQWFGTSTDVHDRKIAEAALEETRRRYHCLLASIDEGYCVIEMIFDRDRKPCDYRFCEVNPTFAEHTGLHQALGKTMRELAPQHEQYWFDIYGKVALTGVSTRFQNEARVLGRWYDVFAFRIDEPGLHRVAILFRDITEQKRVADMLRQSERQALEAARQTEAERQRLDAVLAAVPVGIVVSDTDGAISLTNSAHRRLWGGNYPMSRSIDEFGEYKGWWADGSAKHGQRLENEEWPTARLLRGAEAANDTIEIETFDRVPARRIALVSGASIKDGNGDTIGAVVAQMDITDRVRAEKALREADRRKDEFLAMLAHELRNPLAPIAAAADLLGLGNADEGRVRQASTIISRQVAHMTGLVDDLLDVSRVTRGLVTLNKIRLDAKRIVPDAVEQVRPLIEARRHRLTVHTPPESAFVAGDQKRLVQVMANLLNNAAKYTPEGGDITLSMEVDGDWVRLIVADNGIGMAPDMAERAFDLFAQAERTSDRTQGGLGIGLALVKSLLDLHGGSIAAHSAGSGKGSRFTVCLPHLDGQGGMPAIEREPAVQVRPARSLKVMVVDDNADAAHMLAMLVDALGHQVSVEHSSSKALLRAQAETPDVCLLDIGLPDMDGNQLARQLRAAHKTSGMVLVAVTGYGQERDRDNAIDSGFDYHFVKPVDARKLEALLRTIKGRTAA